MRQKIMLAVAAILMSGGMMSGQTKEVNLRLPLRDLPGSTAAAGAEVLQPIEGRVETATVQQTNAGIHVGILLINTGSEPVAFVDPAETTSVLLLDREGWPLELPRSMPSGLDDRARRRDEPAPAAPKIITLRPGDSHRIDVAITEVLAPHRDGELRKGVPIKPGVYQATVIVTLAGTGKTENDLPPARTLQSEKFTIHLGV
jgi:hypothetical protein